MDEINRASIVHDVAELLVNSVKDELRLQGHVLTGRLMDSLEVKVQNLLDGFDINLYMEDYGKILDSGTPSENIPYSPGSGNKTSKYISALVQFVKLRGMASSTAKAERIAFAIAATQKKEGMPTIGSKRYSIRGKRTGFLSDTVDDLEGQITELLETGFDTQITVIFNNLIEANA